MAHPLVLQESLPGLRRMVGRYWPYSRKERSLIAGSLLALFAGIGLRLLEPWPLKFVIDRVSGVKHGGKLSDIPVLDALSPMTLLTVSAMALVVITGLRALADYCHTAGFSLVGNRVLTQARNGLYRHLQCLSLSFHTKARSGDLIIRIISDVNMETLP